MCITSIFSTFNLTLHHILDSIWKENSLRNPDDKSKIFKNLLGTLIILTYKCKIKKTAYTFRDKILQWLVNIYSEIHFFLSLFRHKEWYSSQNFLLKYTGIFRQEEAKDFLGKHMKKLLISFPTEMILPAQNVNIKPMIITFWNLLICLKLYKFLNLTI